MPKKSKRVSSASAASILGVVAPKHDPSLCVVCLKEIPAARIAALKSMQATPDRWTHVNCSTVTKVKGLYLGEAGTSQLQLCKKVYNDSVRSVFRKAELDSEEAPEAKE